MGLFVSPAIRGPILHHWEIAFAAQFSAFATAASMGFGHVSALFCQHIAQRCCRSCAKVGLRLSVQVGPLRV